MSMPSVLDEPALSEPRSLQASISMHTAPLLLEQDDVFGDSVNLAARVVKPAKPREILMTANTSTQPPATQQARVLHREESELVGRGARGLGERPVENPLEPSA